jgi:hypothetical protein
MSKKKNASAMAHHSATKLIKTDSLPHTRRGKAPSEAQRAGRVAPPHKKNIAKKNISCLIQDEAKRHLRRNAPDATPHTCKN